MSCERTPDEQIGEAVLIGVIKDQLRNVTGDENNLPLDIPEGNTITNEQDQRLVEQIARTIRDIGDRLDQDPDFNDMIDGLGRVADKSCFGKLVEAIFRDEQINWGRIILLFYAVGKLSVKMVLARLHAVFSDVLALSLEFIRKKLVEWIHNVGGWMNSISEITRFSIERFSTSSISSISSTAALSLVFISGTLLGAYIVWRLNRPS